MPRATFILPVFLLFSFTLRDQLPCSEVRLLEKTGFPVGTALDTEKLKNEERYWQTALSQFNSFTPEMVMKPWYLHPKKDQFNFSEIDHLMAFCKEHQIRLHGHTLVWHKGLPPWIENFKGSKEEWEALLRDHIYTIVNHCKSYVKSWDVVNEAFNDDGTLRRNVWLKNIGESYIEKAFQYAAEEDPGALLFYNDYSIEKQGEKLDAILKFFGNLKAKGIKVDGFGMQMHVTLEYPTTGEINKAALSIENAGFMVHYSELDIRLNEGHKLFVSGRRLLEMQRQRMKEIVKGYMKLKPQSRFGITLWGVSDNDSWLTERSVRARPLLYNSSYKIKPAYCGFLEGLQE
jgi:endo-1,4-beta-xylanase